MTQIQFSPLSIYKSIDANHCGVDSEVSKAVAERGVIPATWHDHAETYRPTEIVAVTNWDEAVACIERGYRVRSARDERDDLQEAFRPSGGRQGHAVPFIQLVCVDPIGDGNDAETAR